MNLLLRSSSACIGPQGLLFLSTLLCAQRTKSLSSVPTRDMTKSTDQSKRFWDRIAEKYSKQPIGDEAAYQKKLQVTQRYFRPDMQVLEIGCGTGGTALIHAPHVKHIEAIDISSKMIDIAKEKAREKGVQNVTFRQSTIDDLRVADGSLDAILGLSILHLLENKDATIARVHRMLKPGGIFVTSTTCIGDFGSGMKVVLRNVILPVGKFFGVMPSGVQFITKQGLRDSITDAGFKIDYVWQPSKDKAVFMVAKKSA